MIQSKLGLDFNKVAEARKLARNIANEVQGFVEQYTTVAVERTLCRLMGIDGKVLDLARRCSTRVVVPEGVGCCAFAGDKGFTHPEMNAYALRNLRAELERHAIRRGYSNSRTCEIGLTTHGGIPYQHLVYLVLEATSSPTPS